MEISFLTHSMSHPFRINTHLQYSINRTLNVDKAVCFSEDRIGVEINSFECYLRIPSKHNYFEK
jgi:hypothetical protein